MPREKIMVAIKSCRHSHARFLYSRRCCLSLLLSFSKDRIVGKDDRNIRPTKFLPVVRVCVLHIDHNLMANGRVMSLPVPLSRTTLVGTVLGLAP